jgi:hypothetical protein
MHEVVSDGGGTNQAPGHTTTLLRPAHGSVKPSARVALAEQLDGVAPLLTTAPMAEPMVPVPMMLTRAIAPARGVR